mmetsp:Transcript_66572/g.177313  ORF Transcript_66572/g.177313 Transcript_66572/m.177313 type:complete len:210 (-) Transcript_66572:212-841(-)
MPQSTMTTAPSTSPSSDPCASILFTTSPSSRTISPKTTCFLSRCLLCRKRMKNCELLECGPEFAIERRLHRECRRAKLSSRNLGPYMDRPPVPSPLVMSPPCAMKPGTMRWNLQPLKCRSSPLSPVQRQRKFSAVIGTMSAKSSISSRPEASTLLPWPRTSMSRKTVGFGRPLRCSSMRLCSRRPSSSARFCLTSSSCSRLLLDSNSSA